MASLQDDSNLSQIVLGITIPAFVINKAHVVILWNKACEKVTGIPSINMVGTQDAWKTCYSKMRPVLADLVADSASEDTIARHYAGKYSKSELVDGAYVVKDFFPNLGKDGKWLFFAATPIKNSSQNFIGAIETFQDITKCKQMENELKEKRRYLQMVNQALKASLDHREVEKRAIEESILLNLKRFVYPYLESLEKCDLYGEAKTYLNIINTNLDDIFSQQSKTLFGKYMDLTPMEIRIADFIRDGKSTKEIAQLLGLSPSSIEWHRKNIREKFGITNKKINLQTYLAALIK